MGGCFCECASCVCAQELCQDIEELPSPMAMGVTRCACVFVYALAGAYLHSANCAGNTPH